MELLKEADFRKEIKSTLRQGYFFFGEEDYLKLHAVKSVRELVVGDPAFAIFNEIVLDALDFTPDKLAEALMPLPMMSERKLVLVKGLNFNGMSPSALEELCDVLATLPDYDYNLLILSVSADCFDAGSLPKAPSATLTRLAEHLTPVQFERCSTSKLAAWTQKHFLHNGITAEADFCQSMVEYCGHDMFILASEIDKLSFYLRYHSTTVPTDAAMRLVCTPANEYDVFTFTNAIMEGRPEVALGILSDYKRRRIDPIIILGEVSRVVCDMATIASLLEQGVTAQEISAATKMHSFRVGLYQKSIRSSAPGRLRKALDACDAADKMFKSPPVGYNPGYTPLERLICGI